MGPHQCRMASRLVGESVCVQFTSLLRRKEEPTPGRQLVEVFRLDLNHRQANSMKVETLSCSCYELCLVYTGCSVNLGCMSE